MSPEHSTCLLGSRYAPSSRGRPLPFPLALWEVHVFRAPSVEPPAHLLWPLKQLPTHGPLCGVGNDFPGEEEWGSHEGKGTEDMGQNPGPVGTLALSVPTVWSV